MDIIANEEGIRIKKAKDLLKENGYELISDVSIKCCQCDSIKTVNQSGNYLASDSKLHANCKALFKPHKGSKKVAPKPYYRTYIPYCQECLATDKDFLNISDVINTLTLMDKPYIKSIWGNTMKKYNPDKKEALLGLYCKNLAMNHKDMFFKDSDSWIEIDTTADIDSELSENNIPIEIKDKYGYGYKDEEYLNFERKYKKMTVGYKEKTSIHTERFLDYIIKKVKEEMAIADGNVTDAAKYETMAKNAAQAAKLNVSQLSKSDITGGIDLIPQLIEAIEEHASLIPLMPKLKEVPYDDADLIIWGIINKIRRLEDKSEVEYREIWDFYDDMLQEHFTQKGYDEKRIEEEIKKRETPFRDLGKIYIEPLYADEDGDDNGT